MQGVNGDCDTLYTVNLTFSPNETANFNHTTCDQAYSVVFGSTTFNFGNPSGTALVQGVNGDCDTLYTVNLTFGPNETANFNYTTCDQAYSVVFGSTTFDFGNPSGTALVQGVNGDCDTLYTINLTFSPNETANFNHTTCDQAYSVVFGSTTFDFGNPSGTALVQGVNGDCDTLYTVSLTFGTNEIANFNHTTCLFEFIC